MRTDNIRPHKKRETADNSRRFFVGGFCPTETICIFLRRGGYYPPVGSINRQEPPPWAIAGGFYPPLHYM
ncbi:MAG: hypothetical protein FWG65_09950 [Turicibacter sp.]|nr:hypothetical protein [Turicibacter sp.]